jgi:multidrug resistance protein
MASSATPRDSTLDFDVEKGKEQAPSLDGATITPDPAGLTDREDGNVTTEKREEAEETDPNVVSWDGPDDPQNPKNWTDKKKWTNVAILSILTIITPLGSSMFAPGIPQIMIEFHNSNSTVATFILSIYILGFAFGPLVIAPLSEIYGRWVMYNIGNILFTVFTVGTALSNSIGMIMAFRFLMGLAGSVPITIGSGSIADIMPIEKRGRAMSVWALGPLLGPCIGPVAGGYLTQAAGWRWVFWLIVILGGVCVPVAFFALQESYAPLILQRKARRLQKATGNPALRSMLTTGSPTEELKLAIVRPLKLLFTTPIITLTSLYVAITYGILYLLITTFSYVYSGQYHFGEGTVGLSFIPAGLGMMIGVVTFGMISDMMVKRTQASGLEHKPEIRIKPVLTIPCGVALPIGLFIYGWTADKKVHWIVPMIGVVIFTAGLMGVMMCIQNYLLDSYPQYAASVTAALTVLRSILGALLPLGGLQMYEALGIGWGNSLLAFISLALIPIPVGFYIFGERLRRKFNPVL